MHLNEVASVFEFCWVDIFGYLSRNRERSLGDIYYKGTCIHVVDVGIDIMGIGWQDN